jgi:hypothetical protein
MNQHANCKEIFWKNLHRPNSGTTYVLFCRKEQLMLALNAFN